MTHNTTISTMIDDLVSFHATMISKRDWAARENKEICLATGADFDEKEFDLTNRHLDYATLKIDFGRKDNLAPIPFLRQRIESEVNLIFAKGSKPLGILETIRALLEDTINQENRICLDVNDPTEVSLILDTYEKVDIVWLSNASEFTQVDVNWIYQKLASKTNQFVFLG